MKSSKIRLSGVIKNSLANGEGMRYVIFFQGCSHQCSGCHNQETWNSFEGFSGEVADIKQDILKHQFILTGITLSGGEPFEQPFVAEDLALFAHSLGLNVWAYTGYLYEDLKNQVALTEYRRQQQHLLGHIDVLVDGPFIEKLKDDTLKWRGSSNQRVLRLSALSSIEKIDHL